MLAISFATLGGATDTEGRIVAVGDVHGDIEGFRSILRASGLLDSDDNWSGGAATLVQTGDLVERGTKVRQVLDLMMRLKEQAPEAGGKVVAILGNHEVNNLLGYLDYNSTPPVVYAEIFAAFTDDSSEDRRQRAFKQWARWRHRYPQCGKAAKQEWEEDHPLGYVEYFESFSPEGRYGRWLRSLPAMAQVGSTLFAHGGPSPWLATKGLDSVYSANRAVSREIEAFDRARGYLVGEGVILPFFTLSEIYCAVTEALVRGRSKVQPPLSDGERERLLEIRRSLPNVESSMTLRSEGPLWYRGFAKLGEQEGAPIIADLLNSWKVKNIVVAHTPQRGNVEKRFDNVFLIDTGMVYGPKIGGRASALEINAERFTAVYDDGETLLADYSTPTGEVVLAADTPIAAHDGRWLSPNGTPLPFDSAEEIHEFLQTATVVSTEDIPTGVNGPLKILLEQYGIQAHAIFRHFESEERNKRLPSGEVIRFFSDSYRNEVAAWEVARMVGYNHLYPAIRREVQGRKGSVQLWVEEAFSERERLSRDIHPTDLSAWLDQGAEMRVFDNLINNFDRNQTNILVDSEWKVWLIDHTRSFGREQQLPDRQYLLRCSRELWERIRLLDEKEARQGLRPHLSRHEIDAFLARRKQLIGVMASRIAELGEDEVLFSTGVPPQTGAMRVVDSDSLSPVVPAAQAQR